MRTDDFGDAFYAEAAGLGAACLQDVLAQGSVDATYLPPGVLDGMRRLVARDANAPARYRALLTRLEPGYAPTGPELDTMQQMQAYFRRHERALRPDFMRSPCDGDALLLRLG